MSNDRLLILRDLLRGPRSFWDVVANQNCQHRRLNSEIRSLLEGGLIESSAPGMLALTAKGRREASLRGLAHANHTCPTCLGRGVVVDESLIGLQERFRSVTVGRPPITTQFDQGVVPADLAFARAALLDQRGDLAGKDVLILGDDDLMSLAFALTGLPRRICVLEVDARVTTFLRQAAKAAGLDRVEVIDYDAREALPDRLRGQFDVFFTDPVETVVGIVLFLSRCAEALRGADAVGYFGLTNIESGWAKWLGVQRAAVEMNLAIAEAIRDFNRYVFIGDEVLSGGMKIVGEAPLRLAAPDRLWFSSTIFRLRAAGELRPAFIGAVEMGRELYADEDTI